MFKQILSTLGSVGPLGPLVFMFLYATGSLFFVFVPFLTMSAGALFGFPAGFVLASISSLASAAAGFLAGRHLSRKWVFKKIASNQKIKALDDAVTKGGWKVVLLLRLSAILPFTLMNYGLGLSKLRFRNYILASWAGMMPGMLLYAYLGSLAGKMFFEKDQRKITSAEWLFFALGLVVTVGISIYVASVIKKVMKTGEKSPIF